MAESPSEAAGPAGPLLTPTGLKGELWGWRGSLSPSQSLAVCCQTAGAWPGADGKLSH